MSVKEETKGNREIRFFCHLTTIPGIKKIGTSYLSKSIRDIAENIQMLFL